MHMASGAWSPDKGRDQRRQFNFWPSCPSWTSPVAGKPGCVVPWNDRGVPYHREPEQSKRTHRNQSTAMMSVMSSVGRPTDVSTMTMVTRPA